MNFLKKVFHGNSGTTQQDVYIFKIKCRRCGEIIESRVDIDKDLSAEYGDKGDTYFCRKVLMGSGKNLCYQQIEVELRFNSERQLIEREIVSGGEFAD